MRKILKQVTVTGADDSIQPESLIKISNEYPFVEFGILCSKNSEGLPRFPTDEWIWDLRSKRKPNVRLSMHLCGSWMRQLLFSSNPEIFQDRHVDIESNANCWINEYLKIFKRVQLNFHGEPFNHINVEMFVNNLKKFGDKQIIFQLDIVNNNLFGMININKKFYKLNAVGLWDLSHGSGTLSDKWFPPISDDYCGYAGGLSPDNLKENLEKLCGIVGETPIWVDAETHLRSNKDKQFDLDKVVRFLEIAKPYVIS